MEARSINKYFMSIMTINAQEYLDKCYPLTERSKFKELDISEKNLTGSLDLTDFINLERLDCYDNKLINLILPTNSKLTIIYCWNNKFTTLTINQQEYLKELNCSINGNLTTLTVTNNLNLTKIYCHNCNLSTLTLTNNPQLASLLFSNNQLTNLNFLTNCHNKNSLTLLNISNNKLTGELATLIPILNKFTNLRELNLSDNKITGSLPGLSKLKVLAISNINLTGELEYLPESLEKLYCSGTKFAEELKDYENIDGHRRNTYYNYQAWRSKNKLSLRMVDKIKILKKQLVVTQKQVQLLVKEKIELKEEKITSLIQQIQKHQNDLDNYLLPFNDEQKQLINLWLKYNGKEENHHQVLPVYQQLDEQHFPINNLETISYYAKNINQLEIQLQELQNEKQELIASIEFFPK